MHNHILQTAQLQQEGVSCDGTGSVIALLHVFAEGINSHLEGDDALTN